MKFLSKNTLIRAMECIDESLDSQKNGKREAMKSILAKIDKGDFFQGIRYTPVQTIINNRKENLTAGEYLCLHTEFFHRYWLLIPDNIDIEKLIAGYT